MLPPVTSISTIIDFTGDEISGPIGAVLFPKVLFSQVVNFTFVYMIAPPLSSASFKSNKFRPVSSRHLGFEF